MNMKNNYFYHSARAALLILLISIYSNSLHAHPIYTIPILDPIRIGIKTIFRLLYPEEFSAYVERINNNPLNPFRSSVAGENYGEKQWIIKYELHNGIFEPTLKRISNIENWKTTYHIKSCPKSRVENVFVALNTDYSHWTSLPTKDRPSFKEYSSLIASYCETITPDGLDILWAFHLPIVDSTKNRTLCRNWLDTVLQQQPFMLGSNTLASIILAPRWHYSDGAIQTTPTVDYQVNKEFDYSLYPQLLTPSDTSLLLKGAMGYQYTLYRFSLSYGLFTPLFISGVEPLPQHVTPEGVVIESLPGSTAIIQPYLLVDNVTNEEILIYRNRNRLLLFPMNKAWPDFSNAQQITLNGNVFVIELQP